MKMLNLAMRIHAMDNDGAFTSDILQLTNELGNAFEPVFKELFDFDFVNNNAIKMNLKGLS